MEKKYTFPEILSKAEYYCSRREACQYDIAQKLKNWGATNEQSDTIIAHLVSENYLSEIRFANAYVHDSFYLNHWGRLKIKKKLIAKFISKYSIEKALKQITIQEYQQVFEKVVEKKWNDTNAPNKWDRWAKVERYVLNRGFEQNLLIEIRSQYLD